MENIVAEINSAKLETKEDLIKLENRCSDVSKNPEIVEPIFRLFEKFPKFDFGNPGNLVRILEKFSDDIYIPQLYNSIRRTPNFYNLWMLNRLLNSFENHSQEKEEGISLFKEALSNRVTNNELQTQIEDYLKDQEE